MFYRPSTKAATAYALLIKGASKPRDIYPTCQEVLGISNDRAAVLRGSHPFEPAFRNEVRWALQDLKDEGTIARIDGRWQLAR